MPQTRSRVRGKSVGTRWAAVRPVRHDGLPWVRGPGKPGRLRVGTASWTDPGFVADWYPPKLPAKERLRWYAEHFNLVEVNASFYSVPSSDAVARWCEQTTDDFVF